MSERDQLLAKLRSLPPEFIIYLLDFRGAVCAEAPATYTKAHRAAAALSHITTWPELNAADSELALFRERQRRDRRAGRTVEQL